MTIPLAPTALYAINTAIQLAHRARHWLDNANGDNQDEVRLRIIKVFEEVGEVCAELAKPAHDREAAAAECADVIVTALTAQASLGPNPTIAGNDLPGRAAYQPNEVDRAALMLAAEAGRLAAAIIGEAGQNPRKGRTHDLADIQHTLSVIAGRAALLIALLGYDPTRVLLYGVNGVSARLDKMGVPA